MKSSAVVKSCFVASLLFAANLVNAENLEGTETTTQCYSYSDTALSVVTRTVYNQDQGENYFRIQFKYTGLIEESDEIYLYLSFTPTNLVTTRTVTSIAEDIGYCKATVRASETIFWDVEAYDLYATCTAGGSTNVCSGPSNPSSYQSTTESTSENNWTVAITDDDEDNRFCTRPSNYLTDQSYACSAFTCYIERLFDTRDTTKDMIISDATGSSLTVYQNRCWAQIGTSTSYKNAGPVNQASMTINILSGAFYGASAAATAVLVASAAFMSF